MSVGKFTSPQLEDYQKAAARYRKEFLAMPIIGLKDFLPYANLRANVRGEEVVGNPSLGAELAPYKYDMETAKDLNVVFRSLKTYLGAINIKFDPNTVANKLIGMEMSLNGEAQKNSDIARAIITEVVKDIAAGLNRNLFSAVRNANGTTTASLFDGYDTITATEITAGNIAAGKHNFVQLAQTITAANAVTVLKAIYRAASAELRNQDTIMFVSHDIMDMYNDAYETLHAATPYNERFEQTFLEGSGNRCTLVPVVGKADSPYIHLTTKENMLIGCDQLSDMESVEVARFSAFTLNFIQKMFFGVQFETLDSRRLMVAKLATAESSESSESGTSESGTSESGTSETSESSNGEE